MKTKLKELAKYLGFFAASAVISRLVICGVCMPSSAALCAALPLNALGYSGAVGALLGTISLAGEADSIRMFCCCLIILGIRVALDSLEIKTILYQPLLCLTVVMSTGIVSISGQGGAGAYIALFISTVIFSVFTAAVKLVLGDKENRLYKPSLVFFLAVLAVAAVKFEFFGVSLGRVTVLLVIPLCSQLFGSSAAITVSALCGAAFSFTGMTAYAAMLPILAALYCLISKKSKWLATTAYFSVFAFASCLLDPERAVITVCEGVAAYLIFMFAPKARLVFIKSAAEKLLSVRKGSAVQACADIGGILREKAEHIRRMQSQRLALCGGVVPSRTVDIDNLSDAVCSKVCSSCRKKEDCWVSNYGDSTDSIIKAAGHLKNGTAMTPILLDGRLYGSCVKSAALCTELNKSYIQQTGQENDAFGVLSDLLEEAADTAVPDAAAIKTAEGVKRLISDGGADCTVTAATCAENRASFVVRGQLSQTDAVRAYISAETGKEYECFREDDRIIFLEKTAACVTVNEAARAKKGEKISGDRVSSFCTGNGKFVVIISDGMGSGDIAAAYSRFVSENLKRLICEGTSPMTAVKLVGGILASVDGDFFATADLLIFDMYTLEAELIKAGAALSVLKRKGKFFTVSSGSMPLGIAGEEPKRTAVKLKDGDMLLLFTDGVVDCDENCSALTSITDSYDEKCGQALSSFIISQLSDVSRDDMSVVCFEVHKK